MRLLLAAALLGVLTASASVPALAQQPPAAARRNVVLFVADGLRAGVVNDRTTPAMAALMKNGVRFSNSHSLFPTFTTANASALATGHYLGDTGDFSNNIYVGFPVPGARNSPVAPIENDTVLGDLDRHFDGDFLNEDTILKLARTAGLSTAAMGKLGPTLIFDHTERSGQQTIIFDDTTGRPGGIPLSDEIRKRLEAAGLPAETPPRGDNARSGNDIEPGTKTANLVQQAYLADVATKIVLPLFKERGKPFVLVYWSRDPDGSQHNQGDSLNRLVPGINGPTSFAGIRNADDNLAQIQASLKALGLEGTTDVILTSDHGFSTISKESATSFAATQTYKGVTPGQVPPGFVAIDLARGLGLNLYNADEKRSPVEANAFPTAIGAIVASAPEDPGIVVVGNGGSDLIYLTRPDPALAARIVGVLSKQDYTSGVFVADALGKIPGTLPLSAIAFQGTSRPPMPSIVLNFRSFSTGCDDPTTCGVELADIPLRQGQGMHGTFSRADTRNTMGAIGPSFRKGFDDTAPASNADFGKTIVHLLGLKATDKGKLLGRVLSESMPNGAMPKAQSATVRSAPDGEGHVTVLQMQSVGETRYFDAAGYPGRTLGLPAEAGKP
jgi:arylsulfatase A-like enzyme